MPLLSPINLCRHTKLSVEVKKNQDIADISSKWFDTTAESLGDSLTDTKTLPQIATRNFVQKLVDSKATGINIIQTEYLKIV